MTTKPLEIAGFEAKPKPSSIWRATCPGCGDISEKSSPAKSVFCTIDRIWNEYKEIPLPKPASKEAPPSPAPQDWGEFAYSAYSSFSGGRSLVNASILPEWEKLPYNIQEAWGFVADSLINAFFESSPKISADETRALLMKAVEDAYEGRTDE